MTDNAHDVGFRTEELSADTAQRVNAAKQSSELAEKVKVTVDRVSRGGVGSMLHCGLEPHEAIQQRMALAGTEPQE